MEPLTQARATAIIAGCGMALIIWWHWKYWATAKALPVKLLRLAFLVFGTMSLFLLEKHIFKLISGLPLGDDLFSTIYILTVLFWGATYGFHIVKAHRNDIS